jgi:hypothetical protein
MIEEAIQEAKEEARAAKSRRMRNAIVFGIFFGPAGFIFGYFLNSRLVKRLASEAVEPDEPETKP